MTNFEQWKEKILEIAKTGDAIAVVGGKPVMCNSIACTECEFLGVEPECLEALIMWFCADHEEHEEKPSLTKKERMFCEIVETGWIVRDKDGSLMYFVNKPVKIIDIFTFWYPALPGEYARRINWLNAPFEFIKWEDPEPWSVEELLKLKVNGN